MQRDLSSPMDASMSTRNQGQLVSTQSVVTQVRRVGNMRQTSIQHPQASRVPRGQHFQDRPIGSIGKASPLSLGRGFGVSRAQGLSEITINALGTTSWKWIGASMLAGIVLWKLTAGRRNKAKERTSKAIAALKGDA